ncbi:MAG: glycosyltransferase [Actinomycetota bacterium]|nr:glycosyltransferase [Actinomycetota bacterium]
MSALSLVLAGLGWPAGLWLLWHLPRCRPSADASPPSDVSVVVPARDEEANLPRLLASLAATGAGVDLVVVDDHSSDSTAEVARRAGARVVPCPPLPSGWTGKAWACWTGSAATDRPVLVFLDADTEVEAGGLAALRAEHGHHGGLVSVQPFHRTERAYESLSAFFNVVAMMGVGAFTPLGNRRRPAGAFGPCLVCTRADYHLVGGHRAVRGEVVEDVALSARFGQAGLPVTCFGGRGTIAFRMYGGGLRQLVEGWSKNFAAGAGAARPATVLLVAVWVGGCLSAVWPAGAALAGLGALGLAPALALYGVYAAQVRWMLGRLGRFRWWAAALYPVPLAFFVAVFARSSYLTHVRREVRWRGRAVATGRRRGAGRR